MGATQSCFFCVSKCRTAVGRSGTVRSKPTRLHRVSEVQRSTGLASVGGDLLVPAGSERLSRRCNNPSWRSYPACCIHSPPAAANVSMCTFVTAHLPTPTHCLCAPLTAASPRPLPPPSNAPPALCESLFHRTVFPISVLSPHQRFRLPSPLPPSTVTASIDCQFPETRSLPSPPLPPRTATASPYRRCYPHCFHRRYGGNGDGDGGCGWGSGRDSSANPPSENLSNLRLWNPSTQKG